MNTDKILEKLKKLILLRDHPDTPEAEAMAAGKRITTLLFKYNMEESDVSLEEKLANPIISISIPYKSDLCGGNWYTMLVTTISNNNLCKCLIIQTLKTTRRSRESFEIIGRRDNLEVVSYMISAFANLFYKIGKDRYATLGERRQFITENKFLRAFLAGCVQGLNQKYKELKIELSNCTDLIISNDKEIAKFLGDRQIKKGRQSKEKMDESAYILGVETGKNADINKGIKQTRRRQLT